MHVLYGRAPSPRAEVHLPTKIQTAVLATSKSEGMNLQAASSTQNRLAGQWLGGPASILFFKVDPARAAITGQVMQAQPTWQ
jgi:hypothetical protein